VDQLRESNDQADIDTCRHKALSDNQHEDQGDDGQKQCEQAADALGPDEDLLVRSVVQGYLLAHLIVPILVDYRAESEQLALIGSFSSGHEGL